MPDDVKTTLLKFSGDAAGAKAAAQEVAAAVGQVEAAARRQAQAFDALDAKHQASAGTLEAFGFGKQESIDFAAQQQTADMLDGTAVKADGLAKSFKGIGDGSEHGIRGVRGLSQALALVSPEAAEVVRGLHDVQEGMEFLGQAGAAKFLAYAGAVAAVAAAFVAVDEAVKSATESAKAFAEQQQRIKDATLEVQKTVATELGKRGVGSEAAFNTATNTARSLEQKGFDKSAAAQVAAATVDQAGNRTVDNATIDLLTAGVQRGDLDLGGKNDKERANNFQKALREIKKDTASFQGSAQAFTRIQNQRTEAAQAGDISALKEYAKTQGASDEEADRFARAQNEKIRTGDIGYESSGGFFGDAWKTFKAGANRVASAGVSVATAAIPFVPRIDNAFTTEAQDRQALVDRMGMPKQPATYNPQQPVINNITNAGPQYINVVKPRGPRQTEGM